MTPTGSFLTGRYQLPSKSRPRLCPRRWPLRWRPGAERIALYKLMDTEDDRAANPEAPLAWCGWTTPASVRHLPPNRLAVGYSFGAPCVPNASDGTTLARYGWTRRIRPRRCYFPGYQNGSEWKLPQLVKWRSWSICGEQSKIITPQLKAFTQLTCPRHHAVNLSVNIV